MRYRYLLVVALGVFIVSAVGNPLFAKEETVAKKDAQTKIIWSDDASENSAIGNKQVIGKVEKVIVEPGNLMIDARIDTGATKTSLGAEDLQIINEDGEEWALFKVEGILMRSRVDHFVRIKRHGAASQRRPVVVLRVTLGDVTQNVHATLTDRSNFKYKMLVGVNFLIDRFIVDVSQNHTTTPHPAP